MFDFNDYDLIKQADTTAPDQAFLSAMESKGYSPGEILAGGKIHRFDIEKRGDMAGWYVFYGDNLPAGSFGDWRTGSHFKWCAKAETSMDPGELAEFRRRIDEAKRQRIEEENRRHAEAAIEAARRLSEAQTANNDHPYLTKKQVKAFGIRQDGGRLLVPMHSPDGTLWSLQEIDETGKKKNLTGGKKRGCCHVIEGNSTICLCEGYATGATLHEATGDTVLCCFDAGNMLLVAKEYRAKHPHAEIIIAADDDRWKPELGNSGMEKGKAAADAVGGVFISPRFKDLTSKPTDFNDLATLEGLEAVKEQLAAVQAKGAIAAHQGFRLFQIGELSIKTIVWLVRNLIEANTLSLIFGDPACGKSFLAVALACSIAAGVLFCGRRVKQGLVIYIAGEGQNGLTRRFMAWCIRNRIDYRTLPVFVSSMPASLCDADQFVFVENEVKNVADEFGAPVLIVIDTLARNFGSGDENSTSDMNDFIQACDRLRVQYGAAVLLVHHTGHADKSRARGAIALKGALDAEYRMDRDETGVCRLECTKMKDAEIPSPMAFSLRPVELPFNDDDGNPVTSAILDDTSYQPRATAGKQGRGKWQTVAMEALGDLADEHRQRLSERGFNPDTARVLIEDWRDACLKRGMDRRSFFKVRKTLTDQCMISISDGFVE